MCKPHTYCIRSGKRIYRKTDNGFFVPFALGIRKQFTIEWMLPERYKGTLRAYKSADVWGGIYA